MAEYAAFPYLQHKEVEKERIVYEPPPKPLTFGELYSPRDERIVIHKSEKSYWRTRDRIEYCIIEDRKMKVMIVTCRNLETKEDFRTIFIDLENLYFELEFKARDTREFLTKKKDKKLDDKAIHKAAADFILARLMIKAQPSPWPSCFVPFGGIKDDASNTAAIVSSTTTTSDAPAATERMCTFDKLTNDKHEGDLEVICPPKFVVGDTANTKLAPTVAPVSDTPAPDAASSATVPSSDEASAVVPADSSTTVADAAAIVAVAATAVDAHDIASANSPAKPAATKPTASSKPAPKPSSVGASVKVGKKPSAVVPSERAVTKPGAVSIKNAKKVVPI